MQSKILALGIAAAIATVAGFSAFWFAGTANAQSMNMTSNDNRNMTSSTNSTESMSDMKSTVVRDSVLVVGPKTIPAGQFIHLYDSTPYMIASGHVALKAACDANSETPLQVLIGHAPDLKPAEFELIKELSKPGEQCIYHVDLVSNHDNDTIITDVALSNPTDKPVRLPITGSIFVGVDEIMPGAEGEEHSHEG